MSEANLYTLFSQLDDMLFLIQTLLKNAERTAQKDADTTDKLNKVIIDCYMNHPDNTQGPKAGRWSTYSSLSDKLEKHMESFATAKGLHARSCQDLLKLEDQLNQIKSALLANPHSLKR